MWNAGWSSLLAHSNLQVAFSTPARRRGSRHRRSRQRVRFWSLADGKGTADFPRAFRPCTRSHSREPASSWQRETPKLYASGI